MATIVRTPSDTWKAVIRMQGWPTTAKTFRIKRGAEGWARRTEVEMVRGVYIERGASERLTLDAALKRYLSEVTPTKKPTTQQTEVERAKPLRAFFGKYSLAANRVGAAGVQRASMGVPCGVLATPCGPALPAHGWPSGCDGYGLGGR